MTERERQPGAVPDDDRPWERPGAVRRDCAPHRGNVLMLLATVALVLGLSSFCLGVTGWAALPLAFTAEWFAQSDLKKMRAGRMDRSGRQDAERARELARYACAAGGAGGFWCGPPCGVPLALAVFGGF